MEQQIKTMLKENYLNDWRKTVILYSGGKDSSYLLTLFWEMLLELPPNLRTKTVHIMTADTGVEAPVMSDYLNRCLMKIKQAAAADRLPIEVELVKPSMRNNFWYRVLGRGTLISTPNTKHHPCTHWLKIGPTQAKFKEWIASAPIRLGEDKTVVTAYMGVRNEESARRKASISKYQIDEESLWARHSDFNEVMCCHPIKFVTSDEIWLSILEKGTLPFGVTAEELSIQYGEGILECGIKTSNEQGNSTCGGNGGRLGCWTCGMVSGKDPMLTRFIAEGHNYEGLLEWKNLMLSMRNDIRFREVFPRQYYNRISKNINGPEQVDLFDTDESTIADNYFETYQRATTDSYAPGGMTLEGRRLLLEHLLFIQERDGHALISENEIQAVLEAWEDTEGVCIPRTDIKPTAAQYDGELVFLPNKTVNRDKTKNKNKVFYISVELNKEENELYTFMKERQRTNQTSLFYFPDCQEFKDKKLVWNKATFVVCREGIKSEPDAVEYVHKWLGWRYGFFTEETKQAALNYLILSALSEGFQEKSKKEKYQAITRLAPLQVSENDNGQLVFAI
ncbi:phosphoadenosine phosphosulfate reductase domain-containing protein [Mesobacillus zeae]|uniref:phosphoadenosine phosphosulfate reductase domain-containing protein n=1 Tax=Mesobacillus zeae TaxID=1917180 RepID=UPI00300B9F40